MPLTPVLVSQLEAIVGRDGLVTSVEGRLVYECDMHTFYKGAPDAVVLPTSAEQVREVVRACRTAGTPVVPRGSGTGLIGGAMAPRGGVMVATTRMNGILEVDLANRCATVQPGLINLWLSHAVRERGYFFAPDPSSQMVSSIGGNVSTNAGGRTASSTASPPTTCSDFSSSRAQASWCGWEARRSTGPGTTSRGSPWGRRARSVW